MGVYITGSSIRKVEKHCPKCFKYTMNMMPILTFSVSTVFALNKILSKVIGNT